MGIVEPFYYILAMVIVRISLQSSFRILTSFSFQSSVYCKPRHTREVICARFVLSLVEDWRYTLRKGAFLLFVNS